MTAAEPGRDVLRELRLAAERATVDDTPVDDVLSALALVARARAELDELERLLIEAARDRRASWARVAGALGLASRQAAEQRWLRLAAQHGAGAAARDPGPARAARARQRSVDRAYGPAVADIRAAAAAMDRAISTDPDWDGRHPRAALARQSVAAALDAPPGGMFSLASAALEDLDGIADLPAAARAAADRLRSALHQSR